MDAPSEEKLLSPEDFLSADPAPEEGRYRLLAMAGRGGTATVWRAAEAGSGRVVALKLLAGEDSPARRARLEREARALLAVRHPAVLPLLDAGSLGGRPFLVFPWVEQPETLRGLLTRGPLPLRRAVEVVAALADALASAHAAGVAHRDLKPENVLLERDGRPVLIDFGLARGREWSPPTGASGLPGAPGYMSPEQVCGAVDSLGPPGDVHGLGVLLHELLTGRLPWPAGTDAVLLRAIESVEPAPPGLDPELDRVCRACLVKDPEQRPTAREVQRTLAAWLEGGGGRSAAPRWLAALAVVLTALGLAWGLVLLGRG